MCFYKKELIIAQKVTSIKRNFAISTLPSPYPQEAIPFIKTVVICGLHEYLDF